jgi:alpha-tubulin suppressor-like RCC1 family protein
VFSWGSNSDGQLGDGTFTARLSPVAVGGIGSAVSIAGGASHATILKSDGSIWSMGQNVVGSSGMRAPFKHPRPSS